MMVFLGSLRGTKLTQLSLLVNKPLGFGIKGAEAGTPFEAFSFDLGEMGVDKSGPFPEVL